MSLCKYSFFKKQWLSKQNYRSTLSLEIIRLPGYLDFIFLIAAKTRKLKKSTLVESMDYKLHLFFLYFLYFTVYFLYSLGKCISYYSEINKEWKALTAVYIVIVTSTFLRLNSADLALAC